MGWDKNYCDSKIKPAVRQLLVSEGMLREKIKANLTGLTFLATDEFGRFDHESKIVKTILDKVKNEDFSKVTEPEFEAIAEAALSVHTKIAIAETQESRA